jgi:hypothetical protein
MSVQRASVVISSLAAKKYVSSARPGRSLDIRSAVRTQYEIALNAIIVINTTAKPQPNNIVLL